MRALQSRQKCKSDNNSLIYTLHFIVYHDIYKSGLDKSQAHKNCILAPGLLPECPPPACLFAGLGTAQQVPLGREERGKLLLSSPSCCLSGSDIYKVTFRAPLTVSPAIETGKECNVHCISVKHRGGMQGIFGSWMSY